MAAANGTPSLASIIASMEDDLRLLERRAAANPDDSQVADAITWRREKLEALKLAAGPVEGMQSAAGAPSAQRGGSAEHRGRNDGGANDDDDVDVDGSDQHGAGGAGGVGGAADGDGDDDADQRRLRLGAEELDGAGEQLDLDGSHSGTGGYPRRPPATLTKVQIQQLFDYYANFGRTSVMGSLDTIDSFMFFKFCKECPGLLDRSLSRTDVDLVFTKAKAKHERRLTFPQFLDALSAIAEKKFPDLPAADSLIALVSDHLAPCYEMVQMEMSKRENGEEQAEGGVFSRLHDVRNYTGVYAERFRSADGRINGHSSNRAGRSFVGNTNTGTDEVIHSIASIMRPNLQAQGSTMKSPRTRSVSPKRVASTTNMSASTTTPSGAPPAPTPGSARRTPAAGGTRPRVDSGGGSFDVEPAPSLDEILDAMNTARNGNVEPLCNVAQRLYERLALVESVGPLHGGMAPPPPPPAASPARRAPGRQSTGTGGRNAWDDLSSSVAADAENLSAIKAHIAQCTAQLRMLPDDSEEYARVTRELRHYEAAYEAALGLAPSSSVERALDRTSGSTSGSRGGPSSHAGVAPTPGPVVHVSKDQVFAIFEYYANFGRSAAQAYSESMDSFMFTKLAREAGLLEHSHITRGDVDLIFTKAKRKTERRIEFPQFLDALAALAERVHPDLPPAEGLVQFLSEYLAPLYNHITESQAEVRQSDNSVFSRLNDVRTFTGVYRERFVSGEGRINSSDSGRGYEGNTNTGTNEVIHNIASVMRPNLSKGGTVMAGGRRTRGASPTRGSPSSAPVDTRPRWGVINTKKSTGLIERQTGLLNQTD